MFQKIRQRIGDWYAERNDREQLLIKIAGVVLPIVALAFVAIWHNQSLNEMRNEIDRYEQTLDLLGDIAPKYRGKNDSEGEEASDKFSREVLENNDIQLNSFVATHATAVGLQPETYDDNKRRLDGGDEESEQSPMVKFTVDVEVREARIEKVKQLLERIETADDPVVIERVTLSKKKRDTGKVRAEFVVTTFKPKAEG